jgi:hypothetical protein
MYTPYVRFGTTGNYLTQIDSALNANGAVNYANPLGTLYAAPINTGALTTAAGAGAPPVLKYVQYLSTANPAPVAAPAPVYWKDETFTVVTGVYSEGFTGTANSIAGYLLVNTTSVSSLTATVLTNSGNGVGVWIQIGGWLSGAYAPTAGSAGVGNTIIGSAGNWTSTAVAAGTAGSRILGMQLTAVASSACDVLVGGLSTFWGS